MSDDNRHDVLSPEQLELNDEHIQQLDENRYVVTFEERSAAAEGSHDSGDPDSRRASIDLSQELGETEAAYAFEARGRFETDTDEICVETNDVSEALESLLYWYARNVADDAPPKKVITVLLANLELDLSFES
jgi:hypothetical protein